MPLKNSRVFGRKSESTPLGIRYYSTSPVLPVKIYSNPDKDKKDIYSCGGQPRKGERSGIYLWENKINDKTYIGSSQDLRKIIWDSFDSNNLNNPKSSIIYKALSKYGLLSPFGGQERVLKILEYCSIKDLMVREQYYVDTLKPDYNILSIATPKNNQMASQLATPPPLGVG